MHSIKSVHELLHATIVPVSSNIIVGAVIAFTGVFLAKTESPFLCARRDFLESRLSDAIFKANETDVLLRHVARFPEAIDAVERLIELMPKQHPVHQTLLKHKLYAAN